MCAASLRPTPAITTNAEHICPWTKIRRTIGRSNGSASLLLSRCLADFIISIVGSSFWQAHLHLVLARKERRLPVPRAAGPTSLSDLIDAMLHRVGRACATEPRRGGGIRRGSRRAG